MKPKWKYTKGSAENFKKAPIWATVRTRITRNGKLIGEAWLERHEIGARAVSIGYPKQGEYIIEKLPTSPDQEEVIAQRAAVTI